MLEAVGLEDAARRPVNTYSHGMQKRLSFARALLTEPPVLLVDEATHDLDPGAATQVRALATERAEAGAAIVWATQRIEELPGFAGNVTVLATRGRLLLGLCHGAHGGGGADRHLLGFARGALAARAELEAALGGSRLEPARDGDPDHAVLVLAPGMPLGRAIAALEQAGAAVLSCRDERPPIERAFLAVTGGRAA